MFPFGFVFLAVTMLGALLTFGGKPQIGIPLIVIGAIGSMMNLNLHFLREQ